MDVHAARQRPASDDRLGITDVFERVDIVHSTAATTMGTRGYYVYRWRGWYFIHYNHLDSYPDVLGLMIHGEVPPADCAPGVFDKWFESATKRFNPDLKRYKVEERRSKTYEVTGHFSISREQPQNDIFIE